MSRGSQVLRHIVQFALRVLRQFQQRRGLLLSSAIAYNVLLSVVPLGGLLLVSLSGLVDGQRLQQVITVQLENVLPGQSDLLLREVDSFLRHRELLGGVSLLMVLFFGSVAFRVLGEAMTAIFADVRRDAPRVRGFWGSVAVPFLFVGLIAAGLIGLTLMASVVESMQGWSAHLLGVEVSMHVAQRWLLGLGGVAGELTLFTAAYRVFPGIRVRLHHAAAAGAVATLLWEVVRRMLVWYLSNISIVGVVYGSLSAVVVSLMSAELAAVILLLGAQVLAELTHARQQGRAWHEVAPAL